MCVSRLMKMDGSKSPFRVGVDHIKSWHLMMNDDAERGLWVKELQGGWSVSQGAREGGLPCCLPASLAGPHQSVPACLLPWLCVACSVCVCQVPPGGRAVGRVPAGHRLRRLPPQVPARHGEGGREGGSTTLPHCHTEEQQLPMRPRQRHEATVAALLLLAGWLS